MLLLAPSAGAYAGMPALSFSGGETNGPLLAAYDLALKNLIDINTVPFDVAKDRTGLIAAPSQIVQAGADYPVSQGQIWTRDSSINVMSAASLLEPKVARDTLWADCDRQNSDGALILYQQDGQFWDRIIWISAAWHHFEVTNDTSFLTDAYQAAANSLTAAENAYRNATYGLFKGPSHINDGISGYPSPPANDPEVDSASFDNPGVTAMMALSTNVIYYAAYQDAAAMADALGRPASESTALRAKASALKTAINDRFWLPSAGRYGYFIGGTGAEAGQLDPSQEALGLALALLSDLPSADQASSIVSGVAIAPRGITDVYPSFPRYDNTHPGRHNMSVWPYIQGVWAYAMAAIGNEAQFRAETERMAYLTTSPTAASDRQFYEIYNFQTGLFDGGWQTGGSWGSAHNQTWSATGFLRAIYEGLFGMRFTPNALRFAPVLPAGWGDAALKGVTYRGMTLNIELTGAGNSIASFQIDGHAMTTAQVPGTLTGTHQVEIALTNAFSNVARDAVATSSPTASDYPGAAGVNDGKINGYLDDADPSPDFNAGSPASGLNLGDERQSEWVSSPDYKTSAWVQLDWSTTQSVRMVRLFDRINTTDHITAGTLTFSDGSTVAVPSLPNDGFSAFEARFPTKMIRWIRFTVAAISDSTFEPGLAELEVLGSPAGAAPDTDGGIPTTDSGLADASSALGEASADGSGSTTADGPASGNGGASGNMASDGGGGSEDTATPGSAARPLSGCGCSTPGSPSPRRSGDFALLGVGALLAMRNRKR